MCTTGHIPKQLTPTTPQHRNNNPCRSPTHYPPTLRPYTMHNNSSPPSRSLQSYPGRTKHPPPPRTKTLPRPRASPSTLHYIPINTQHIHPIPRQARRHSSPPHTTHLKPTTPLPSIPPQCNSPPCPLISRTPLIPHMCHITHPSTITRHSHQPSPETPQN